MICSGEKRAHLPSYSALHSTSAYSSLSDTDILKLSIDPNDKINILEEILTEISVYFGILYHLIEIFKGHDDFADELSTHVEYPRPEQC